MMPTFMLRVEQGEGGLGHGVKRKLFVSSFYAILYGVCQEIELAAEMGEKRLVNLGEFQLPLRQGSDDFIRDGWRDGGGATVQKFDNLRHAGNLPKTPKEAKTILWGKNRVA